MRGRARTADRRPDPPALPTDDRPFLGVGTLVWAVLGVAALIAHPQLSAAGHGWWVAVCGAGVALGLVGLLHEQRRTRRRR